MILKLQWVVLFEKGLCEVYGAFSHIKIEKVWKHRVTLGQNFVFGRKIENF